MDWLESLPTACHAVCDFAKTGHGYCLLLDGAWIKAAAKRLLKHGYFLEDVTCLDVQEGFVLLYHFDLFENPGRVTIRVLLDREAPTVPSIADVYQGAEWHERECMDFFPVVFKGNPNPERLLLPAGMDEHPLAKAEKDRAPQLDLFHVTEVADCPGNALAQALAERLEADKAAAEAAAEAAAAEAAAKAAAKAAAAEEGEKEPAPAGQ